MSEIEVIKYLIEEIEQEQDYAKLYEKEKQKAIKEAENVKLQTGKNYIWWKNYMTDGYSRVPNKTLIRENAKKIRQLLLKFY